jgi:hypothetical protein
MPSLIHRPAVEVIGFITRSIASTEAPDFTVSVYSVHTILVLVAPSVFAASIYMCLGRLILITEGERHSLIRVKWLTKIFVIGDVIAFLLQGAGGGIMASGTISAMHLGENVIIGGLVVQILFFSCFVVVAGIWHWRVLRVPTGKSMETEGLWKRSIYSLYAGSVLIWVRCVFRLIEYAQGMCCRNPTSGILNADLFATTRQRRLPHLPRSLPVRFRRGAHVPGHGDIRDRAPLRNQRSTPGPRCEED